MTQDAAEDEPRVTVLVADATGYSTLLLTQAECTELAEENDNMWVFVGMDMVASGSIADYDWSELARNDVTVRFCPQLGGPKCSKTLLIGAGGIGSQLAHIVAPAFTASGVCHLELHIMDSDVVETENLTHQRFFPEDVGQPKVEALVNRLQPFVEESNHTLVAVVEDLTDAKQLEEFDFVIVAVDNSEARLLVHEHAEKWLDLRCGGDGYTCYDDSSVEEFVSQMTPPDQPRASCQQPGAVEEGNIEMGYAMAAAHGAQWLIQSVRQKMGVSTHPPQPRTYSLTHGELNLAPATVQNGTIKPPNHGERWTPADNELLIAEAREGRTITEMAESLGRTQGAIRTQLFNLFDFSCIPMRDIEAEGEA